MIKCVMVHHSMMSCYTAIIDCGVGEYVMTWKGFIVNIFVTFLQVIRENSKQIKLGEHTISINSFNDY